MNEQGVYVMLNCGSVGPGPVVTNMNIIEWQLRWVVASLTASSLTPDSVLTKLTDQFASAGGGISGAGSVLVFATPSSVPHGFIGEVDRFGGEMRLAVNGEEFISATNHFLQYGVDPNLGPTYNFGLPVSYDTRHRYDVTYQSLQASSRLSRKLTLTTQEVGYNPQTNQAVSQFMQRPARGWTEHSVAFSPADKTVSLSVAVTNSSFWDAPYTTWFSFAFNDFFQSTL